MTEILNLNCKCLVILKSLVLFSLSSDIRVYSQLTSSSFTFQSIFKKDITTILKRKIEDSSSSRDLLYHICCLFRHLVLDDDVRVEFSQAHEHARTISSDNLSHLTKLLFSKQNMIIVSVPRKKSKCTFPNHKNLDQSM